MAASSLAAPSPSRRPFKQSTILFIAACVSILSFYAGIYTGIKVGASSCNNDEGSRGLKGALDASAAATGAVGGVAGVGRGVNSASGGVGCTPQCLAEIKTQDGELMRRVEMLAREKVQSGKLILSMSV
jgi:hypothetical protein